MNTNENNPFNDGQSDFGLPGDYFKRSADSIFNKIAWQEEHKEFPMLLKYKNSRVFEVPENYFKMKELKLELLDLSRLHAIQKINPFNVPVNYFEESEAVLLSRELISDEQELFEFKTLNTVSKQPPFKTPEHYFVENSNRLTILLKPEKRFRVIGLFSAKSWYAAAALLLVALGLWTYNQYIMPADTNDCGTIACIDKVDLIKTKTLENFDNEELYEIVNTKQLEQHLNTGADKNNNTVITDSNVQTDAVDDLPDGI